MSIADKNIIIDEEKKCVRVIVNPKIFNTDVVMDCSYVYLDKNYIVIDGDPEKEITIEITPKSGGIELKRLGLEFYNELINYADYHRRAEKNKELRELMVRRALFSVKKPETKENHENKNEN